MNISLQTELFDFTVCIQRTNVIAHLALEFDLATQHEPGDGWTHNCCCCGYHYLFTR